MSKEALIVFAKNPELGKVKTRLAKTVGDKEALSIYKKLLAYTQQEVLKVKVDVIVYYTPKILQQDEWHEVEKKLQSTDDLGQRMSNALKSESTNYDKVCIIGTDCAQLTAEHIENAFTQLNDHDFVLGPANDGGYYLLGLKLFQASIFNQIEWSTDQVLHQTINQIKFLNKNFHLLPELIDVDTIEDWKLVMEKFD